MTCKDEATIAGVVEALKAKYHDGQEHTGAENSYLGMSLYLTITGVYSITRPRSITDVLRDVDLGNVVTPTSNILFIINESSPLYLMWLTGSGSIVRWHS